MYGKEKNGFPNALGVIMCNKVHFSFLMWKERKGWRATNTEIARDTRVEGVKTTRAEIKLQWVQFSLRWGNERAREVERSTWKYRHTSLSEKCMLTEEESAREPHERLESPLCLNKVRWHSIKPSDRSDSGLQRNRTKNSMYGCGFMHMYFCMKSWPSFCRLRSILLPTWLFAVIFHTLKWLCSTSHFLNENNNSSTVSEVTVQMMENEMKNHTGIWQLPI